MNEQQAQFTPGPWAAMNRIEQGAPTVEAYLPCINGLSAWVVVADCGAPDPSEQMFGGMDHEANARLIAAAPELLEALDGLMTLESRGRIMPIGKEWDAARAAIAKATGSNP
jgi:hypothetical protein